MKSTWALFCLKEDVRVYSYKPEPAERSTSINHAVTSSKDYYLSSQETSAEHLCQRLGMGTVICSEQRGPSSPPSFNCPLQTSNFHPALYLAAFRGDSHFCRQNVTLAAHNTLQVPEENHANFWINENRTNRAVTEAQHPSAGILATTVSIPCSI